GYAKGANTRFVPTLEAYGKDGASLKRWVGDGLSGADLLPLAWAPDGGDLALFAAGERDLHGEAGAGDDRLHVFEVGPDLAPRPLFTTAAPTGAELADATLTPLGRTLLVTLSERRARYAPVSDTPWDDYEQPLCVGDRSTWVELRDRSTGKLLASQ